MESMTGHSEAVLLESEESDPLAQIGEKRVQNKFVQINKMKGYAIAFTVFNDTFVSVIEKDLMKKKEYHLDLGYFNKDPVKKVSMAWKSLLASVILAIGTWILMPQVGYSYSVLGGVASFVFFVLFIHGSSSQVVFVTQNGKVPVIRLMNNFPNRKLFKAFVDELSQRIEKAQTRTMSNLEKYFAKELKETRRLKEEGVLTEDQYNQAKDAIFSKQK